LDSLDATWDFGEFDNWDTDRNNNPDGKVEMIIFIWRNIAKEFSEQEETQIQNSLNFGHDYGSLGFATSPDYLEVDGGARKIYANDWGSGVSIRDYVGKGHKEAFRVVVHEVAHYLIGHNNNHNGFGFWGMLSAWGYRSIVANSWEKSILGWNDPLVVSSSPSQTISDVELGDYITTGDAIVMEINPSANEYFYIENHQVASYWESTFAAHDIEPGIYVIRRVGSLSSSNPSWLQLIAADGRFDWEVNQATENPWEDNSAELPVFKQIEPNIESGYHDVQFIPFSYGGLDSPQPIHFIEEPNTGEPVVDIRFFGDGKDAFRIDYNQVFSPWSNPNNQRALNDTTSFGFEITNFSNGIYTLNIFVGTSADASPSKPQNLKVGPSANSHPLLTWDSNIEPDTSGYKIYKKVTAEWGWQYLATTTSNSYEDQTEEYLTGGSQANERNVDYRITAIDTQSKESVPSDKVTARVAGAPLDKKGSDDLTKSKPTDYFISQNYPNPFNPTTVIKYQLPKAVNVTIKLYDMLGREVKEFINDSQEAGYYELTIDGSDLSSGTYIYRITAGDFVDSKKLILLK